LQTQRERSEFGDEYDGHKVHENELTLKIEVESRHMQAVLAAFGKVPFGQGLQV
jgi:hypothetical protein